MTERPENVRGDDGTGEADSAVEMTPTPPRQRPGNSLGYIIRDTHLTFGKFLRGKLAPHKVTLGQWFFLRALWEEEGLSQRELSQRVNTTEPTTVSALRVLERNGLVKRVRNTDDRRTINVFLTDKGRTLKERLLPLALEVNKAANQGLSAADIREFKRLMKRMRDNVAAAADRNAED